MAEATEEALAALARYVEMCKGDDEAIDTMRKLTGLTVTDPEADRPVMERRLAKQDRKNRRASKR